MRLMDDVIYPTPVSGLMADQFMAFCSRIVYSSHTLSHRITARAAQKVLDFTPMTADALSHDKAL
jgi:hypothetical protein